MTACVEDSGRGRLVRAVRGAERSIHQGRQRLAEKRTATRKAESKVVKIVERLIKALGELVPNDPALRAPTSAGSPTASRAIDRGDREFVCGPTINSVHTVWFEFHEDILSVLGRPRDV